MSNYRKKNLFQDDTIIGISIDGIIIITGEKMKLP